LAQMMQKSFLPANVWKSSMIGRLLLFQGFLHSDHSSKVALYLQRDSKGGPSTLLLKSLRRTETDEIVKKVVQKIRAEKKVFKGVPIEGSLKLSIPGQGAHLGGSFPMREVPSTYESDVLGRPYGWDRVHLIDSSCFSSIPATSLTLTVMANAHRIAQAAAEL
jgi:hypothetical protein